MQSLPLAALLWAALSSMAPQAPAEKKLAQMDFEFRHRARDYAVELGIPLPTITLNHSPKPESVEFLSVKHNFNEKGETVGWSLEMDPAFLLSTPEDRKRFIVANAACRQKTGPLGADLMYQERDETDKCTAQLVGMKIFIGFLRELGWDRNRGKILSDDELRARYEFRWGDIPYVRN
jgi:hypothetical protein